MKSAEISVRKIYANCLSLLNDNFCWRGKFDSDRKCEKIYYFSFLSNKLDMSLCKVFEININSMFTAGFMMELPLEYQHVKQNQIVHDGCLLFIPSKSVSLTMFSGDKF